MKNFIQTIKGIWSISTATLYYKKASQRASFPYVVWSIVSNERTKDFYHIHNNLVIDFNVYSSQVSSEEVWDILEEIVNLYDGIDLNVTGYETNNYLEMGVAIVMEAEEDEANNWKGNISFTSQLSKLKP
jgi:hypothetical protein